MLKFPTLLFLFPKIGNPLAWVGCCQPAADLEHFSGTTPQTTMVQQDDGGQIHTTRSVRHRFAYTEPVIAGSGAFHIGRQTLNY